MKKKRGRHVRKLCAVLLVLCMLAGQSTGAWADSVTGGAPESTVSGDELTSDAGEADSNEGVSDETGAASSDEERQTSFSETGADTKEELTDSPLAVDVRTADGKLIFDDEHVSIKPLGGENGWDFRYTGKAIEPEFEVTYSSSADTTASEDSIGDNTEKKLVAGTDYTLTYSDNTNLGEAKVTIKGTGEYEGTVEGFFYILSSAAFVKAEPDASFIKVTNNHGDRNTVYIAVVSEKGFTKSSAVTAIEVKGNFSKELSSFWYESEDGKAVKDTIKPESTYRVFVCDYDSFSVDPDSLTYNGAQEVGSFTTKPASESSLSTNLLDGSKINFKALTQKNQSVKLSWAPAKKDGYDYKNYSLYSLKRDASDVNDEHSWDELTPSGTSFKKKSFTDNRDVTATGHNKAKTGVYKLVARDAAGKEDSYLMVSAPWLFKTESGQAADIQEFTFAGLRESGRLGYRLETALKNKDNDINGFRDERTTVALAEGLQDVAYPVNKSLNVDALEADYTNNDCNVGTKYFFRVKSVYTYGNLKVTSAPSNVLSRKVGPAKCVVDSVTGITPQEMYEKMDEAFFEEIQNGEYPSLSGVHADSTGTCWKKGFVVFTFDGKLNDVKQVQLLRATKADGKYSVVRKYNVAKNEVRHLDTSTERMAVFRRYLVRNLGADEAEEYMNEISRYYWVEYDNFIPEVSYYYTVQAVSAGGNATGNYGDGVENTTFYEKVQDVTAMDSSQGSIRIEWKRDDCAKEYWIYRSTSKEGLKSQTTPVKKVKSTSKANIIEKDGKVYNWVTDDTVNAGESYYYMVRPVYKADKNGYDYYKDWVTMTEEPVEASNDSLFVKTVTVSVYSVKQLQVKWSAAKAESKGMPIDGYQIILYDGISTLSENEVEKISVDSTDSAFKNRTMTLIVPKIGHTYSIRVKPVTAGKVGDPDNNGGAGKGATKPLPVKNLKITKRTGNNFKNGAKLTFELDSKDQPFRSELRYSITSNDGLDDLGYFTGGTETYLDDKYLERGSRRHYTVRAVYDGADGYFAGAAAEGDYSKPNKVKLQTSGDKRELTLKTGEEAYIYARFYCNDMDNRSTVQDWDEIYSNNSDIVKVKEAAIEDGKRVKIKIKAGSKTGTTTIKIKGYGYDWDGIKDSMEITVKSGASSSSSSAKYTREQN